MRERKKKLLPKPSPDKRGRMNAKKWDEYNKKRDYKASIDTKNCNLFAATVAVVVVVVEIVPLTLSSDAYVSEPA